MVIKDPSGKDKSIWDSNYTRFPRIDTELVVVFFNSQFPRGVCPEDWQQFSAPLGA